MFLLYYFEPISKNNYERGVRCKTECNTAAAGLVSAMMWSYCVITLLAASGLIGFKKNHYSVSSKRPFKRGLEGETNHQ